MTDHPTRFDLPSADVDELVARLPVGVFRMLPSGEVIWANRAVADLLGAPQPERVPSLAADDLYVDPEDRDEIMGELGAGRQIRGRLVELRRIDGSPVLVRLHATPRRDEGGRLWCVEGLLQDVGDEGHGASRGSDLETRFAGRYGTVPGAAALFDTSLRLITGNKPFADLLGMAVAELEGTPLASIDPSLDAAAARQRLRHMMQGQLTTFDVERPLRHASGRVVRVRLGISPFLDDRGEIVAFVGEAVDITDRHPDYVSQATTEALMGMAFDTSPVGMVVTLPSMASVRTNGAFRRMLGISEAEAAEIRVADIFHPDDYPSAVVRMGEMASGSMQSYSAERRLRHRDGRYLWVLIGVCALRGPDGKLTGALSQVIDITERRRIEEALRDSEERFRTAFESAPVGMVLLTPDLEPQSMNAAMCRLLGCAPQEGISLPIATLIGRRAARAGLIEMRKVLAGEGGRPFELELRRRDGSAIFTLNTASAVRDRSGGIVGIVSQTVDITEQRLAQQARDRSEAENVALLDSIPDLMFRMDRAGFIRSFRAGRALGPALPPEAFLGKSIDEVHPEIAEATHAAIESVLAAGPPASIEYDLVIDGETRSFEARISRMDDEQVLAIIRDITDRKRVEEQLQGLIRSKDEFVAAVSHELRTPLTTVVGLASELRDRGEEFSPTEHREFVRLIADQSREMADLVDDLLAAAQADVGLLDVELMFVDLRRQVEEVIAALDDPRVKILGDDAVVVLADPFRVRQVVRNLVTNAVRYGGDTIEIVIAADGDAGRVQVCDDGVGIPPEEAELIFDPYYRAHDREGQPAALGLGLTIGRMLAWLMNGELTYGYVEERSVFELTLPIPGRGPLSPAEM